jgi:outer membrane receptor for ferrienterochelin and colicin
MSDILLQASVKNIFDSAIIYPAPYVTPTATSSGIYQDDLHRDGRAFWLSAQWKFR